jgi:hypothetical protein
MTPPVTYEPIHSAPVEEVQVCMSSSDYVRVRVWTATTASVHDHDISDLLHQLGETQSERDEARESRDTARTWLTWTGVALVIAIGLGVVGVVTR